MVERKSEIRRVLLPFPPSVNNLFAQGVVKGRIRRYPTKRYRTWRKEAVLIVRTQRWKQPVGAVSILIVLTPPDARPRDADNFVKPILDALVEARALAGDDQRYISRVQVSWDHAAPDVGALLSIICQPSETDTEQPDRQPMTPSERREFARLEKTGGIRTLANGQRITKTEKALLDKGYFELLPGIFDGAPPQGIKVAS